jgi:hypothetical protein
MQKYVHHRLHLWLLNIGHYDHEYDRHRLLDLSRYTGACALTPSGTLTRFPAILGFPHRWHFANSLGNVSQQLQSTVNHQSTVKSR